MAGLLFILSAPSGSGKSTLVNQLRSMVPNLDFSVSWTTRAPRGSEQEGREYHFIQRDQFQRMIAADEFMEHADVFGNYYGTARASLAEAAARGNDLLLDIDVQGAAQVRHNMPQAITIFILPPNPDVLERRLRNRSRAEGGVEESVVQKRLATARHEIGKYHEYRYVLVNDVLERAAEELSAIVIAERSNATPPSEGAQPQTSELPRYRKLAEQCLLQNSAARLQPVLASFGLSL
ncbi:MAG: guanylate kinase [Acidobacteriaceae bacterium]